MRERLRKVPELPARRRIPLLREQAQVAAQVEEPLEEGLCLVEPSLQSEVVGEPECARQEGALARREAVDDAPLFVVRIPVDEAVVDEVALDCRHRPDHARIVGG